TLSVDGETTEVDSWYGNRDHSWGIRASMGPHIPLRGTEGTRGDPRAIRIWLPFEVGDHTGFFSLHEDADGRRLDFDGMLMDASGTVTELRTAEHRFEYVEGSSRLRSGEFTLVDEDGEKYEYSFEVVGEPGSPQGYGYVRGWADGDPPGSWRGPEHLEHDRFDVSDPHSVAGPPHVAVGRRLGTCEYPAVVTSASGETGMAQIEHMVYGTYHPYGFA
ncbi:MAG: hypothetical protein QOF00_3793, partial [Pseudonocardiales bacterium]|nr:hypothetical protein [Pseudonocardiales bacterium]